MSGPSIKKEKRQVRASPRDVPTIGLDLTDLAAGVGGSPELHVLPTHEPMDAEEFEQKIWHDQRQDSCQFHHQELQVTRLCVCVCVCVT